VGDLAIETAALLRSTDTTNHLQALISLKGFISPRTAFFLLFLPEIYRTAITK